MREKIIRRILDALFTKPYEPFKPAYSAQRVTKEIISDLAQEIKKVENPNICTGEDEQLMTIVARQAFEQCRQKILSLLND